MKKINTPLAKEDLKSLKSGDEVLLSGTIYVARDQAHKRLVSALSSGKKLPFDLRNAVIYYCGPTAAPKGRVIGSCGPTTASRMDAFTSVLLNKGVAAMIGKGRRSKDVAAAIKRYRAVYFLAYAGCGALIAGFVKDAAPVAYKELGPEAVIKLEVKDLPLIVGIDSHGKDIYA